MRIFRQGDVVIREVEKIPDHANTIGRLTIPGETGNNHVFEGVAVLEKPGWPVETYIQVDEAGGRVVHQEHPVLELPPLLIARVEQQRCYYNRRAID